MKELIGNVKKGPTTYQYIDVFNIPDPLPLKDNENKCDVLLKLNNNTFPAWKKGTILIVGDSKMSHKKLIKVRTFPGSTIQDMRFFVVPHLKK